MVCKAAVLVRLRSLEGVPLRGVRADHDVQGAAGGRPCGRSVRVRNLLGWLRLGWLEMAFIILT